MIKMSHKCKDSDAPYIQSMVKHSSGAYFEWSYSVLGTFWYCIIFPSSESYQEYNNQYDALFHTEYKEIATSPLKRMYNKIIGTFKNFGA
jgi:hypothetical protein